MRRVTHQLILYSKQTQQKETKKVYSDLKGLSYRDQAEEM